MRFSKAEACLMLFLLESFLPEAEDNDQEAIEGLLQKLQSFSPASPFRSATEARKACQKPF